MRETEIWEKIYFESKTIQIRRSMEYRYSAKEWRIGEPKSKSGYRTIPLTEEAERTKKKKYAEIKGFIGGNRENETWNRRIT